MTLFILHLLRPWWLLVFFLLLILMTIARRRKPALQGWSEICDPHLLPYLQYENKAIKPSSLGLLWGSCAFMILALSGPAWHQSPVATYKPIQPRMLLLDVSDSMMQNDLTPNRLSRAKFKLHDLLKHKDVGQFGLIAYTAEPFVVSPLTDDGQTIAALLNVLTPDIMPVKGQKLYSALQEAARLLKQAGYQEGQILVLTSSAPSTVAIETAATLAKQDIHSSIMPVLPNTEYNPSFKQFAQAGKGLILPYDMNSIDLDRWLAATNTEFKKNNDDQLPLWQDEGRWFLIPALFLLLPVFQRGWLQRLKS